MSLRIIQPVTCNRHLLNLGLLLARLPLGILFLVAGTNKLRGGIPTFVNQASGAIPPWLGETLGRAYLHAVPVMETLVGITMILGLLVRPFALIAALMLVSFMIAVTGWKDPKGGPFNPSVFYFAVAVALALIGAGECSIDGLIARRRRRGRTP